jgi:hypothetical protein
MEASKIVKNTQEQAVASWINYLNQLRLDNLVESINQQDLNLEKAIANIDNTFSEIEHLVESNRGGLKGLHGFIAEVAEVGIGNARQNIEGKTDCYEWVNDNGPIDLLRDGVGIQQKFYQTGLSLGAISKHLEKYPNFIQEGGKYQIPEEQYEKIKYLLSIPKEQADKMATSDGTFSLKQWKAVQEFFGNGKVNIDDIEPSILEYKDVQAGKIAETLDLEKDSLLEQDDEIRKAAYERSKPSLNEGIKATAVSSIVEGATALCMSISQKIKTGKRISDFDKDDWMDIADDTGKGIVTGGVRGVSIYMLTNYTATPAAVASSLVTASVGIADQANLYRKGIISEQQFIENSELLSLDVSVSALSSLLGQVIIPIPVLGAVIGNTVGTVIYKVAKDGLDDKEQEIFKSYIDSIDATEIELNEKYKRCKDTLAKDMDRYMDILNLTYSADVVKVFNGSVEMAKYMGVPSNEILDSKEKIDSYFIG